MKSGTGKEYVQEQLQGWNQEQAKSMFQRIFRDGINKERNTLSWKRFGFYSWIKYGRCGWYTLSTKCSRLKSGAAENNHALVRVTLIFDFVSLD